MCCVCVPPPPPPSSALQRAFSGRFTPEAIAAAGPDEFTAPSRTLIKGLCTKWALSCGSSVAVCFAVAVAVAVACVLWAMGCGLLLCFGGAVCECFLCVRPSPVWLWLTPPV